MASILEVIMLLCFGFSWPINFMKSWRTRSTKGVSIAFLCLIELGYVAGTAAKFFSGNLNYVLAFYFLNLITVGANIALYFVNAVREKAEERR